MSEAGATPPESRATRRQLWRWLGWFIAANTGLCCLIGLRYLLAYQWPDSWIGILYAPAAMIGNFTLLLGICLTLSAGLAIAIWPQRRVAMAIAVLLSALVLALLVLDTIVFAERRMHLTLLVAVLFEPVTWIAAALVFAVALLFESVLAGMIWRFLAARPRAGGRLLAALLIGCWLASQVAHIWADAIGFSPVTRFTQTIPLYYPHSAKRLLARAGLVDPERVRQASLMRRGTQLEEGVLRYPLAPLQCSAPAPEPQNVLWIVIDGLRPDAVDSVTTPALAAFRAQSLAFDNHWSAGNSSRMAAFGMFYGLPSTYFQTFYVAERPPVLLDQFRAHGYELMAASAAGFGSPTQMDRTVFAGVRALYSAPGPGRVDSNRQTAAEFVKWLGGRQAEQPFFSLLWFNHSDLDVGAAGSAPAADGRYAGNAEARARWNHYRRGLRVIDDEIARVLAALGQQGEDARTLVLVMGDHGFEFDDLGLGYYGHASNYGQYQLRTPLLMRWPRIAPRVFTHRTSHFDLPTTLLQDLFGCTNRPADYGVGRNLFAGQSWDWIIAGSYHSWAIVEPQRVTVTTPGGLAEVLGPDYRDLADASLDPALIESTLAEMRRFYR
ncbi:MAG: DUF3413 domain-containing protein [Steroidobacteraceae bacterium]